MLETNSPHRWPAEWERQAATWISWPHNRETWPDRFDSIPTAFERFVADVSRTQQVHVLSGPAETHPSAATMIGHRPNVKVHSVVTNDCWVRDYGPTFVRRRDDRTLVGIDWQYNAWGGKYPPYDDDAAAAQQICRILGCAFSSSPLYCEGGALEGNGDGTLLTTSSCLMSPLRNPGWTRQMVEDELSVQLGVDRIVWVDGGGLVGDDTDGHIDQLARFVSTDVVVAAVSSQAGDENAVGLRDNVRILRETRTRNGGNLKVFELPTPPPRYVGGQRVPESYCNFLFINSGLIVPTFRNPSTDQFAVDLFTQLLPERRVVPMDAYDLIWGLGAFHCASQHQPLAPN